MLPNLNTAQTTEIYDRKEDQEINSFPTPTLTDVVSVPPKTTEYVCGDFVYEVRDGPTLSSAKTSWMSVSEDLKIKGSPEINKTEEFTKFIMIAISETS